MNTIKTNYELANSVDNACSGMFKHLKSTGLNDADALQVMKARKRRITRRTRYLPLIVDWIEEKESALCSPKPIKPTA